MITIIIVMTIIGVIANEKDSNSNDNISENKTPNNVYAIMYIQLMINPALP